jgi:hypothetical protein
VVSLAGGQHETHRQSLGIDDCMNLARQSASRPAHRLLSVACNAGPVLVHPRFIIYRRTATRRCVRQCRVSQRKTERLHVRTIAVIKPDSI